MNNIYNYTVISLNPSKSIVEKKPVLPPKGLKKYVYNQTILKKRLTKTNGEYIGEKIKQSLLKLYGYSIVK